MQHNLKYIITTLLILLVLGGGYVLIVRSGVSLDSTSDTADIERRTAAVERDIIAQLTLLQELKLDDSVFTLPVYVSLVDFEIHPEVPALVRPNPFIAPR